LFGRFAENAPTTLAQTGLLPVHAGGNTLDAWNFRRTKPKNIAGAKPALIVLGKRVTRCRQHRQTEGHTRYDFEIASGKPVDWHGRPPN
jgi:hypothetical protein